MNLMAGTGAWAAFTRRNGARGGGCPRCGHARYSVLYTAADRLYRTTDHQYQIVECGRCRLLRLHPQPAAGELGQFYPDNYWWAPDDSAVGRLEGLYRRLVLSDHVRFVWLGLGDRAPVLDVGCGGGSFLAALRRRGVRVVGLDLSRRAAGVAWRENGVPVACGTLEGSPFPAESFGAITLFHVLEHLPEPPACLQAARRLLAPDGRLYAQVPNAACWQFLLLGERWSGIDVPRHLIHFRTEDLEDLLWQCGFRVLRRKFFSLRDNPTGLATSLFPQLEPMSRKVRQVVESPRTRLLKDLLYLAVVAAALPVTALEAAAGAGSTILVEAAKR
ncbi:MAG: class I SAM-dependent methyltransferase [Acidobacteria bacterium]|nr:class I SAM-dependent methyltransferase [Acidobacteriota bacterium]